MDRTKVCTIQTNQSTIQLTHTYKIAFLGCYFLWGTMFNMTYTCSDQAVGGQENELNNSNKASSYSTVGGPKRYQIQINQNIMQLTRPFKKIIPGCYFFNSFSCINHGAVLNPTYKRSDQTAGGQGNEPSKLENKTNSYSTVGGQRIYRSESIILKLEPFSCRIKLVIYTYGFSIQYSTCKLGGQNEMLRIKKLDALYFLSFKLSWVKKGCDLGMSIKMKLSSNWKKLIILMTRTYDLIFFVVLIILLLQVYIFIPKVRHFFFILQSPLGSNEKHQIYP